MTAFGRDACAFGDVRYTAEIRSVNHRYRDIILRIPRNFQGLEQELKTIISSRIIRGRVEAFLQVEKGGNESPYSIELNEPLVHAYLEVFRRLKEQFGLDQNIRAETLCQMKDVLIMKPEEMDLEEVRPGFHEAIKRALDSLEVMRVKEGEAIDEEADGHAHGGHEHAGEGRAEDAPGVEGSGVERDGRSPGLLQRPDRNRELVPHPLRA